MRVPLNENNRLIFSKTRSPMLFVSSNTFGVIVACVSVLLILASIGAAYANIRYQEGVRDGAKKAIDIHNPSEQLEIACAGLWIGEQNKKVGKQ
jgi:hypothetical protein